MTKLERCHSLLFLWQRQIRSHFFPRNLRRLASELMTSISEKAKLKFIIWPYWMLYNLSGIQYKTMYFVYILELVFPLYSWKKLLTLSTTQLLVYVCSTCMMKKFGQLLFSIYHWKPMLQEKTSCLVNYFCQLFLDRKDRTPTMHIAKKDITTSVRDCT